MNQNTVKAVVTEEMTARSMKSGSLEVLATPALIALLEEAACGCLSDTVEEGMTSVGTEINVKHIAPTPVGMTVTATAELLLMDGKRALFRVHAEDALGPVAAGTHSRVLVKADEFQKKADGKRA